MQAHKETYSFAGMTTLALRIKKARASAGLTQKALADKAGVEQPVISQLETGKNLKSAFLPTIADACGVSAIWLATGDGKMKVAGLNQAADDLGSPSEKDYALIPQFTAKGSCGDGFFNEHVQTTEGLVFKRDWLRRIGAKPENLYVIYADGDSMEPYIFEGDVVLFDTSQTEPKDKQVYVIRRPDGGNSIKRLTQQLSGAWVIRSDNPDKAANPDEVASEDSIHHMPILGRVIWRGGGVG